MSLLDKAKNVVADLTGNSGSVQNWIIVAEGAECVKNEDLFSKSDAYLKIDFGGQCEKTHTIKNEKEPKWNETFSFKLREGHARDITLKLMDSDTGFDDGIGSAVIPKSELPSIIGEERYFKVPIIKKDQITAYVHLRIKHLMDGPLQSTSDRSTNLTQPYGQTYQMNQPTYAQPYINPNYNQKF